MSIPYMNLIICDNDMYIFLALYFYFKPMYCNLNVKIITVIRFRFIFKIHNSFLSFISTNEIQLVVSKGNIIITNLLRLCVIHS